MTQAVSVVGFKDSGKTRVVEVLVRKLVERGYRVGTVKHTAESVLLDTPGKDTWRHREAGSIATAILHGKGSAIFLDNSLSVREAIKKLGTLDFIITEGFKTLESMAKLVIPRNEEEITELSNGLEIGIVNLNRIEIRKQDEIPVISIEEVDYLTDLVEQKAFPILPELDCHGCGYDSCLDFGKALLNGESKLENCVGYIQDFNLLINGEEIILGPFVQDVTKSVVLGLVSSFKGVDKPRKVVLNFDLGEKS
jgi:molybdopterin-guanine dinucleotide biosynthesis protein B